MNTKLETTESARVLSHITVRTTNYSFSELADIYNQTRIDYIVPMPMNARRMEEYVTRYDVRLDASFVSLTPDGQPAGIAMLGIRDRRAWVTRLGIVPAARGFKAGRQLASRLLAEARACGALMAQLEVIVGNEPALRLFLAHGFAVTRELIVTRRPPAPAARNDDFEALTVVPIAPDDLAPLLNAHETDASWIGEPRSILQAGSLRGFWVRSGSEMLGWTIYHHAPFQLEHVVIGGPAQSDPQAARALLYHIQKQHPRHDTKVENIPAQSPLWPAFQQAGYIESFRRLEMISKL